MKSLLIVDDQTGIRLLLDEVFRQEGFKTRLAANGMEALQALEEEVPGCVLLDMKMPGIDGIEVLKRLKSGWPEVPVIMMTAYGEIELIDDALEIGAVKYFTKPFDIYEVRDAVIAMFEN
ncbi:response regulator [Sporosarcina limicola]|uniref:Two-component system response regulator (Stage 0 sporulation protein F) n=1 Tax=Sporosarcina limicola TaxID=34101 RepID=A0A927MKT2_9BACL|nr:response regulator [Sporosarcina limicola]MBE1555726.1 two-component system response regulator (stage 0 sporulation protein F) [Sporosarcina limicola]